MRNPNVCRLAALVALALAACGASNKEISQAKAARYKGDKATLFTAVKTATAAKYKIETADDGALTIQTMTHVYDPNGMSAGQRNSDQNASKTGYNSMFPDKSIMLSFAVALLPDGDAWVVQVKPTIQRYHAGSPQPEPLTEGDISLPGWVQGRIDQLSLDIHSALAAYQVKTLPAPVPPPATAPAAGAGSAAPAAPAAAGSAAPAADGSAAPAPAPASP